VKWQTERVVETLKTGGNPEPRTKALQLAMYEVDLLAGACVLRRRGDMITVEVPLEVLREIAGRS
jgi:hypothetical protein